MMRVVRAESSTSDGYQMVGTQEVFLLFLRVIFGHKIFVFSISFFEPLFFYQLFNFVLLTFSNI